jgi:hypothetical protein
MTHHGQQRRSGGRILVDLRPGALRAAVVLVSLTLAVVLAIAVAGKWGDGRLGTFLDPDAEFQFPAFYSAALLLGAGVLGVLLSRRGLGYLVLGLGLLYMAVDELVSIHEEMETATGVDWEVLYLPVFGLAAVVLVGLFRRTRQLVPAAVPWLAAGMSCWVVSQVLEFVEWDGDVMRAGYRYMMFTEEISEVLGTLGILLALLQVLLPSTGRSDGSPGRRPTGPGTARAPEPEGLREIEPAGG